MAGKQEYWDRVRAGLKVQFQEMGITSCEIQLEGCRGNFIMSFAHRHKRAWYNTQPELLGDIKQVVLGCCYCHDRIEKSAPLTQEVFLRLRGPEDSDSIETRSSDLPITTS